MLSRRVKIKIERFKAWFHIFRITFTIMFIRVLYCLFAIYYEGCDTIDMLARRNNYKG